MSAPGAPAPPAPGGRNPLRRVMAWVKRNPLIAAVAGLGGAFLFLSMRGQAADGATTAEGEEAQYGTIVPVMRELSDENQDAYESLPPEPELPPEAPLPPEEPPPADPLVEAPVTAAAAPEPTRAAASAPQGITLFGNFFPGATGHRNAGTQSAPGGVAYTVYAITYPGRVDYWWRYIKGPNTGQWTGPHRPPGSGPRLPADQRPGPAPIPAPAPPRPSTPAPAPRAAAPAPPRTWPDRAGNQRPLSWWRDPGPSRNAQGKWHWPSQPGVFIHSRAFEGN